MCLVLSASAVVLTAELDGGAVGPGDVLAAIARLQVCDVELSYYAATPSVKHLVGDILASMGNKSVYAVDIGAAVAGRVTLQSVAGRYVLIIVFTSVINSVYSSEDPAAS